MIAFPAAAAAIALTCAALVGWDALRRPRPERVIWTIAFLVFAAAATAEVAGTTLGWNESLARIYYLGGAVLVVGILALGELYLLLPGRMPAFVPGLSLLVAALAATTVWSAPIDRVSLPMDGWRAIERGPYLIALAASINAGGTLILAGGALYSAWAMRCAPNASRRALGCLLIALGTVVVAFGGTLTRLGRQEYLYLAMSLGIAIIFAGVLLTRQPGRARASRGETEPLGAMDERSARGVRLISLPARGPTERIPAGADEGLRYIVDVLLPLEDEALGAACRWWSASPVDGDALTRDQARQIWSLRRALPEEAKGRFDRLPMPTQAQLAELYAEVWSDARDASDARGA
jgi:hypothetical protein